MSLFSFPFTITVLTDALLILADAPSNDSDTESNHLDDIREKFGIIEEAIEENKSTWTRLKPKVWKILDDPTSSVWAKVN